MNDQAVVDFARAVLPEIIWNAEDDACECTYQRIGLWKNPYIGETLEVRMCCIWSELYKMFPQHVRVTPAYLSGDDEWIEGQQEWDGEADMPRAIWYRQLAKREGISVPDARRKYRNQEPPKGIPRPLQEPETSYLAALSELVFKMWGELQILKGNVTLESAIENARE